MMTLPIVGTDQIEDDDAPSLLYAGDVVEQFKQCSLSMYAEARRRFHREMNLNPLISQNDEMRRLIEWSFQDWFAFDCRIGAVGLTGDRSHDLRLRLDGAGDSGISPFRALAEYLHGAGRHMNRRQIDDLREVDDTNFVSLFWLIDANAVRGEVSVEDLLHGGRYTLAAPSLAARCDGAHGGLFVNRIARARGLWRPCAVPIYEARRPADARAKRTIGRAFRWMRRRPDCIALMRLIYGRPLNGEMGWQELNAMLGKHALPMPRVLKTVENTCDTLDQP